MSGTVPGAGDTAVNKTDPRVGLVGIHSPLKMWIRFKGDTAVERLVPSTD